MDARPEVVVIRKMKLEDVEEVHDIDILSFALPWTERSFRFEIEENQNSVLYVAEIEGPDGVRRVVGMIVIWVIIDEAHIGSIAVHPDYRQRKIGERILLQGLAEAVERGAMQALLEVRRSNLPAQALYHKYGFEVVGIRPQYYRDNDEDALLMTQPTLDARQIRTWLAELE